MSKVQQRDGEKVIEKIEIGQRTSQDPLIKMIDTLADKLNEIIDIINSRETMYPELVAEVERLKARPNPDDYVFEGERTL